MLTQTCLLTLQPAYFMCVCVCVCGVALEGMEMWVVAPRLIPSVFFVPQEQKFFFRIY